MCVFVCTYPAGHHKLDQTSSGAEDSDSLLMGETHQRLTVNHQQLITRMKAAIPETHISREINGVVFNINVLKNTLSYKMQTDHREQDLCTCKWRRPPLCEL